MPVNLNALIRYKTIDACLSNKQTNCTIAYLIEKCATALSDSTGITTSVSERTIRNDIRILRSDILGFNAPIVINNGVYTYSKDNFSIFDTAIKELDLLTDIQDLLVDEFENLKNKDVKYLLNKLSTLTKKSLPKHLDTNNDNNIKTGSRIFPCKIYSKFIISLNDYLTKNRKSSKKYFFHKKKKNEYLLWGYIFLVLNETAQYDY